MRRKWAERTVIVMAAMASIATSPPRWIVKAEVPPPEPGKAIVLTIEASQAPQVEVIYGDGGSKRIAPTTLAGERAPGDRSAVPVWAGRGRYFVPAGARVQTIAIDGRCSGKLCSGKCKPPDGAFVKVVSAEAVHGWRAEDRSDPVTTALSPAGPTPRYRVTIETSRDPVALELEGAPANLRPSIWRDGPDAFLVRWYEHKSLPVPTTVTWTVRAMIEGACPGTESCTVPAGEAVRIVSVQAEPDAP